MKEVKDRGDQEVVDLPWEMYDIDNNLEIRHTKLTDKYSLPVKELNDILVPMGLMNDKFYTEKTSQIHTMIVTKMRAKQYEAGTCITELKFCCKFLIYPHLVFYTISCQASFGVFVLLCINQTDTIGMIVWAGQTIPSSLIMLIFWCVKKGVKYPYGAPEDLIEYDKLVDFITKERKRIEAENLARKLAWEEQQRQNLYENRMEGDMKGRVDKYMKMVAYLIKHKFPLEVDENQDGSVSDDGKPEDNEWQKSMMNEYSNQYNENFMDNNSNNGRNNKRRDMNDSAETKIAPIKVKMKSDYYNRPFKKQEYVAPFTNDNHNGINRNINRVAPDYKPKVDLDL